nr:hypothetical protein [Tanacetum cinerariifolium]
MISRVLYDSQEITMPPWHLNKMVECVGSGVVMEMGEKMAEKGVVKKGGKHCRCYSVLNVTGDRGVLLDIKIPHTRLLRVLTQCYEVKENQENDKIRSKPDKNGKHGEARKSLKQLQLKEDEKPKKTKKEWPKTHTGIKSYASLKKRRKEKGHICNSSKVQPQGPRLPTAQCCIARDVGCNST